MQIILSCATARLVRRGPVFTVQTRERLQTRDGGYSRWYDRQPLRGEAAGRIDYFRTTQRRAV
jgi:hypothetical protein